MNSALFEPPVRSSYWTAESGLRHCEGFRVESPFGAIGYVEEVVFDKDGEQVAALVVYGSGGRRRVPVSAVLWVDVAQELVRLNRRA